MRDVRPHGLEAGSFSSGQVAEPLQLESKYSWVNEKQEDDENGNGLFELLWTVLDFKPDHGMATDASDEKHSKDLWTFGCENEESSSPL